MQRAEVFKNMESVIQQVARYAVEARFEDLPGEVVHESKRLLLDSLGCALGGLTVEKGKIAVEMARRLGSSREATIVGTGDRVSSFGAAFANGELINAMDFDAGVFPPGHTPPYLIPAPLALAEGVTASGKDLILAVALAHEISTRFGAAVGYYRDVVKRDAEGRGVTAMPSISGYSCTIFGGTTAAGKILNLDQERMSYALGIAGSIVPVQSMGKWLRTSPVAMPKYLMAGWISEAEITSALLAELGYKGDVTILESDYGFWKFTGHTEWNPNVVINDLDTKWMHKISYKAYPIGF